MFSLACCSFLYELALDRRIVSIKVDWYSIGARCCFMVAKFNTSKRSCTLVNRTVGESMSCVNPTELGMVEADGGVVSSRLMVKSTRDP